MDELKKYAAENTVSAADQCRDHNFIVSPEGSGPKILFVGNSITFHSVKTEIGWNDPWGMAASAEEKDYVHVLTSMLRKENPFVTYALLPAAEWERKWENDPDQFSGFPLARDWGADIIVIRISENTSGDGLDSEKYAEAMVGLMEYLDPEKKARFVVTDGFWPNDVKDEAMYLAALKKNARFVSLRDLGQRAEMKAYGLFWHDGVAAHPGDKGMEEIAGRLYTVLRDMI